MSGKKGKSGRASTPAHHKNKQIAGAKGGKAKAGHQAKDKPLRSDAPMSAEEVIKLLPGKNPYDRAVLLSRGAFTYLEGKTREQANGEVLSNEKANVELAKSRGDLLTIKQVEERDERMDEVIMGHLDDFVQFVGTLVPPEKATEARAKAKEWKNTVCAKIAKDLEESRQ